ncbi:hypothetical protein LOAG_06779 [Loa loa]|uniref:Uncharacterized protein n=1 Tax=Loa loa TaxID=7209 RepID=A0A1S0TXY9_LOALO|nr:hypothetical protein LOAG_06779 [Loa loa]EFO21708.2 hypothetical protein LOAG_06779 [Loa loa]
MLEVTNRANEWQDEKQDEGQVKHFYGTEGLKKKKKQIYAKMRAIGRMNWALTMARTFVSLFNVKYYSKFEFH